MPSSIAGTLVVRIIGDTREFERTSRTLGQRLEVLKRAASAAFAAFAVDSVRSALRFDQAFTRIGALTNTSADSLGQLREQVLALSGETAKSPTELADALYFLSSAGLSAAQVTEALDRTARAAAVGLGQSADIAKIVVNALNAYADSGLTATEVTDTLVAAVREGTAEPEEFASALGRILPIASKAGIEFDELVASLSSLSNIGLDVNEGVTAMRGLLQALEAPGTQAAKTMEAVGISAEEMRRVLADRGLLAALRLLEQRTGGNIDVMRKIVPNIRALTGAFGLTQQEAAKVEQQFRAVQDATGSLDKAFKETAQSASFQVARALQDIRTQGQELGATVLPALADVLGVVSDHFMEVAAAFAIIWTWRKLQSFFFGLAASMEAAKISAGGLAVAMRGLAGSMGGPIGAFVALVAAATAWGLKADEADRKVSELNESLSGLKWQATSTNQAILTLADGTEVYRGEAGRARDIQRENALMAARWIAAAKASTTATGKAAAAFSGLGDQAKAAKGDLHVFARMTQEQFDTWRKQIGDDLRDVSGLLDQLVQDGKVTARELIKSFTQQVNALRDYKSNWETVISRGLPEEFAQQIAEMGLKGAAILDRLAKVNDQKFDKIVAKWRASQSAARGVQNAIGGISSALSRLPTSVGISMNITQTGKTPEMAEGGIVTRPTLALIGERGPEAVVPLRGRRAPVPSRLDVRLHVDRRRFTDQVDVAYSFGGSW
jgi:TP901 family phage tail tape measure protein